MLRKLLAGLLVVSWVILSGFDLVEDFKAPTSFAVTGEPASLPDAAARRHALHNIVEAADHRSDHFACLFGLQLADGSIEAVADFKKISRLHKLHRVYRI
jgi:hypothetical protein